MVVSVVLQEGIEYVGGTVNDIDTIFYKGCGGKWSAVVGPSENNLYKFELEMIDTAGNRSQFIDTIRYALPKFIFDRTQKDIDIRSKKAFINAADLIRIENNIDLISTYIRIPAAVNNDWRTGDIPRQSDYRRIRENVEKIRTGYAIRADTPITPEQPLNTYQKWNAVERILYDVFWMYIGNRNNKEYCGEVNAGEGIGIM